MTGARYRRTLPLLLSLLLLPACHRAVQVGTDDPRQTFSIEVRNETSVSMVVSYSDGRGDAILGSVQPARSERFIIAAPATTTIAVRGVASTGRASGPHTVALVAGTTQVVVLR